MEARDAIEILKKNYPKTAKMIDGRYLGGFDDTECELGQAISTAIIALEKQVAISREIIEGKYFCPKCHNLMKYPGYCGCGQMLY